MNKNILMMIREISDNGDIYSLGYYTENGDFVSIKSYSIINGKLTPYLIGVEFTDVSSLTGVALFGSSYYSVLEGIYNKEAISIKEVSFPDLIGVGQNGLLNAFNGCTSLLKVSFPKLIEINDYNAIHSTFKNCTNLTNFEFPLLKKLNNENANALYGAFAGCTSLINADFPELETIGRYSMAEIFSGCSSIISANFPKLTTIGYCGMNKAFSECYNLKSICFQNLTTIGENGMLNFLGYGNTEKNKELTHISFPKLKSIGKSGLFESFYTCINLVSVSFPELISVDEGGLWHTFKNTSLKEIHFDYTLEGNTECTASNMGCNDATVYFDLNRITYTISNIDTSASYYFNAKKIDSTAQNYGYIHYNTENTVIGYKPNYCVYIEKITPTEETPINKAINFVTSGVNYSLTLNGVSGVTPNTIFTIDGAEIIVEGTNPSIIVPSGTDVTYRVTAKGYKSVSGTLNSSSTSQTVKMTVAKTITYNLSYPFTNYPSVLANLVDGSNFEISKTPTVYSGSGIQSSIINGSKSFKVNSGISYGYIKFHTPDTTESDLLTVSVTCNAYAEASYDVGAVFVDTALHQVTTNYKFNTGSGSTDSTYGYILYSSYGKYSNAYNTYSYTLQPNTDYYLQFAYTKDSIGNSYWDRLSITNIKFTDEGTY